MNRLTRRAEFWIALVTIIIGVAVLAFGAYYTIHMKSKLSRYVEINAIVINYKESISETDGSYNILYAEIVEYEVDGVTYTATNSASSSNPKRRGSLIKVAINPNNPRDCIFVGSENLVFIFLFIFGGAFLAIGILFVVRLRKNL